MFKNIFGGKTEPPVKVYYKTINDYCPTFSNFNGGLYDSIIVRACVDAIARNGAKLKPRHIRSVDNKTQPVTQSNIEYLLAVRPNIYMNAYDAWYKVISQLETHNNAFVYLRWEKGKLAGLYPINFSSVEMVEYLGELYVKFNFLTGFKMTVPYAELIHLRRHFNENDIFGDDAETPLKPALKVIRTASEGIINSIYSSSRLRGLLKITGALRPEDLKKQRDQFVSDYLNINNDGGIGALDTKMEFTPIKIEPQTADSDQLSDVRDDVYRYFSVSEKIINSSYNEDEWNAFYESVIEPIAIQLSLECTAKIFTEREIGFGNNIIFEANRLQYASAKTKISLIKELMPLGILTFNEGREIFNMASVPDGDKRIVSLNYIDASKANKYQVGEDDNKKQD